MSFWAAGISAAGAIAGGAISAGGAKKSARELQENREGAVEGLLSANRRLTGQATRGNYLGAYGTSDIFGTRILNPDGSLGVNIPGVVDDPTDLAYNPLDIDQEQLDAIYGNANALPPAVELSNATNAAIVDNDLNRARALNPHFDRSLESYTGATADLLQGRLPEDVRAQVVSDRGELANAYGTPGGSNGLALKDLGLTSLDAVGQGAGMFTNFLASANRDISPVNAAVRPQEHFLGPEFRVDRGIQQESLRAQSALNAADLASRPDPAASGLFHNDVYTQSAAAGILGAGQVPVNSAAALGNGVSQAGNLFGNYLMLQQAQNNNTQNLNGGSYGGTQLPYASYQGRSAAARPL